MAALRRDEGVSDVVGVILMVAVVAAMAAALYVWAFGVGLPGEAPAALSLVPSGGSSGAGAKALTVASVSQERAWSDLLLRLDGAALPYDASLAGDPSFCVAAGGPSCIPTGAWSTARTPVAAGDVLHVHAAGLAGKTLEVYDARSGTMLLSIRL